MIFNSGMTKDILLMTPMEEHPCSHPPHGVPPQRWEVLHRVTLTQDKGEGNHELIITHFTLKNFTVSKPYAYMYWIKMELFTLYLLKYRCDC